MSLPRQKWIEGLQSSSLFRPPPQDAQQRQIEILAYVELFGQYTSEEFPHDIAEIIHCHYPNEEVCLLDDVLATFVLHHPEHGHTFIHPLLSLIIDRIVIYDKKIPPFSSFISLFSPSSKLHFPWQKDYPEQWGVACLGILRVLTHYNRPLLDNEVDRAQNGATERSASGNSASTSKSRDKEPLGDCAQQYQEKKPLRLLTPWITDSLLATSMGIRSDYFRWCGGVMGKYAAGGELKPPITAGGQGPGKHPQLMPSTPRWAVANGAGVILSVCDDEVARYESVNLTSTAVPVLLLPPPTTALDEHLIAGLPPLEPFANLFHRYYAIASPSSTERLLLGLLEAPPSWAPDALDAAVQLVGLLRHAEDYASTMRLPKNWFHMHFLHAIGTALSMRGSIAAEAAAALLFRIISQPGLLFPPPRHAQGVDVQCDIYGAFGPSRLGEQMEVSAHQANVEATAQGVASLMCIHGPDVEWRICTLWEAAYGLLPLSSSKVDLPEMVVATPLQPPVLSWNLFHPLLRVLEYLPRGSPSEVSLMKIFTATVEAILQRTFPAEVQGEQTRRIRNSHACVGLPSKKLVVAELHAMIHSLFIETCSSLELASHLLFVVLTVCLRHDDAVQQGSRKTKIGVLSNFTVNDRQETNGKQRYSRHRTNKERGAVATFDSYVLAAVCALACEVKLFSFTSPMVACPPQSLLHKVDEPIRSHGPIGIFPNGMCSAVNHTRRLLGILEGLLSLKPSLGINPMSYSSSEIVAAAMVAAHISELLRRSKACMDALSVVMRCNWDPDLCSRASLVLGLIDVNGKAVTVIADKSEPAESHVQCEAEEKANINRVASVENSQEQSAFIQSHEENPISPLETFPHGHEKIIVKNEDQCLVDVAIGYCRNNNANVQMDASDKAAPCALEIHKGVNGNVVNFVKVVLEEKEDLCVAAVPLVWQRLVTAPEMKTSAESTSAKQGWRQVVDALCKIVLASPVKAATAIVLQAERDLRPWVARDDTQGEQIWRLNQRIVNLLAELLRNRNAPEALMVLANASDLLLRATDGMPVDGEACTTPQLELLEATAGAAQFSLGWGSRGKATAQGLWNLLKYRLPATVQCLSHSSAHVRALSTSLLRVILHESLNFGHGKYLSEKSHHSENVCCVEDLVIKYWRRDVEQCLAWEVHNRQARGMSVALLVSAANALGCSVDNISYLTCGHGVIH
ncbi:protein GIGANTEA isoform X1 [Cryptomeria japonica]|uniref:Putative GI n=1 Tax=Cryptomeria japonica TaxID=3369 RepID=A0A097ZMV9_CRYJA|nr:protein GIGANTEA isoform X1 [Cryptomeria japonica]XP_057862402.1 protein GIGANTEA isoform X1 [Cryptomeria japonica]BAP76055.1 putative GI [Cryptomeria japonica]